MKKSRRKGLPLLVVLVSSACVDRAPPAAWPEPPPPTLAEPIRADGGTEKDQADATPPADEPGSDPEDGAVRLDGDEEPK